MTADTSSDTSIDVTVGPDWLRRRIRTVAWLLWADAAIVAATAILSAIFASGADRWLLLAPGALEIAVLGYSSLVINNGALIERPLLTSMTIVTFVFLGGSAGQILANVLGPMPDLSEFLFSVVGSLFFGLAIGPPYWKLRRIRHDFIDATDTIA